MNAIYHFIQFHSSEAFLPRPDRSHGTGLLHLSGYCEAHAQLALRDGSRALPSLGLAVWHAVHLERVSGS